MYSAIPNKDQQLLANYIEETKDHALAQFFMLFLNYKQALDSVEFKHSQQVSFPCRYRNEKKTLAHFMTEMKLHT